MRYDLLAQDALRGVVRMALEKVKDSGLPGAHHFFITFITAHDGVELSDALHARYPVEMTIVLQHQFWDLEVADDHFSICLNFNKVPERLVVPYKAIRGFIDPSVQFGLEFQVEGAPMPGQGAASADEATEMPQASGEVTPIAAHRADDEGETDAPDDGGGGKAKPAEKTGEVVSLDSFRKK